MGMCRCRTRRQQHGSLEAGERSGASGCHVSVTAEPRTAELSRPQREVSQRRGFTMTAAFSGRWGNGRGVSRLPHAPPELHAIRRFKFYKSSSARQGKTRPVAILSATPPAALSQNPFKCDMCRVRTDLYRRGAAPKQMGPN